MKRDDRIREFLIQKKMDIYEMIAQNLKTLKVFPENHSLISGLTAEEKVHQI